MQAFIDLLKYIFLGALQGFTEPLPVSSSGHLVIAQALLDIPNMDYLLEVWLNFASLLAVILLFRKKILLLIVGNINFIFKKDKAYKNEFNYAVAILIGIIPAGFVGFFLKDFLSEFFLNLLSVGIALLVTGALLLFVQKSSVENEKQEVSFLDALTIGLFQVFALVPGISRSGTTVVGGLLRKLDSKTVIEFSFMLYIPISVASMGLEVFNISTMDHPTVPFIASFLFSGVLTYFALKWFVHMVQKGNLKYFAFYCFLIGLASIIMFTLGV